MKTACVAAVILLALASTSCTGLLGTLASLQSLQGELNTSIGKADYRVQLTNGRVLTIGVVNSPWQQLPASEKSEKARQIAQVAWKSYADRFSLTDVQVNFVQHKQVLGLISVDSTSDAFRFSAGELQPGTR